MDEPLIVPPVIRNLDLGLVRERLIQKKGWTLEHAERLIEEYREYLALFYFHPGEELVPPTQELDDVWHEHILDTRRYAEDCQTVFGRFIHHVPGLEEGTDRHTDGLRRTRRHWWQRFGRHRLSIRQNETGGFDTVALGSSCSSYMPPAHEHSSFFEGLFSGGHSGGAGGGADFDGQSSDSGGGDSGGDGGGGDGGGCGGGGCGGGGD